MHLYKISRSQPRGGGIFCPLIAPPPTTIIESSLCPFMYIIFVYRLLIINLKSIHLLHKFASSMNNRLCWYYSIHISTYPIFQTSQKAKFEKNHLGAVEGGRGGFNHGTIINDDPPYTYKYLSFHDYFTCLTFLTLPYPPSLPYTFLPLPYLPSPPLPSFLYLTFLPLPYLPSSTLPSFLYLTFLPLPYIPSSTLPSFSYRHQVLNSKVRLL